MHLTITLVYTLIFWLGFCFPPQCHVPHWISLCSNEERAGFCHSVKPFSGKCFSENCCFYFLQNSLFVPPLSLSPSLSVLFLLSLSHTRTRTGRHTNIHIPLRLPSHSVIPCPTVALATASPETSNPKPCIIYARGPLQWVVYSIKKDTLNLDLSNKWIGCDSYLFNEEEST